MITITTPTLTKEQRLNLFLKNNPTWTIRSVINEKLRKRNAKRLSAKTTRLRFILKQRFKYQKTYSQIADKLKISIECVRQIVKKATENYAIK